MALAMLIALQDRAPVGTLAVRATNCATVAYQGNMTGCRFLRCYPKTGGGEDVDFCLRLPGHLVSVPGALAHHPIWPGFQVRPQTASCGSATRHDVTGCFSTCGSIELVLQRCHVANYNGDCCVFDITA